MPAAFVDEGNLALYLRDIARYRPLTPDEERETAILIRKGDEDALRKLVLANLRFVVSVARNYQHQGVSLSDLINEGNVGLVRAARRFDHRKNFKFISYAVWWIRQAILQALAEQSRIVRLPLNRAGALHRIGKAQAKLEQHYRRSPNAEEIAEELNVREGDVTKMIAIGGRHASLDAPLAGAESASLHQRLHDSTHEELEQELMQVSLKDQVHRTLEGLSVRESEVVKLYFGIGETTAHTLDEIGQRFSLTRERVRQIKESALSKLKQPSLNRELRRFH
ncbi:MAG: sigma-70 family RNA polymerase sigma factor [Chitinivibrionales bacterium]|nr:sigma-70 family RNA polymerase sigma factor [Chitinivibrionales bacterium]MBD3395336.1 sigma-70 family RNA polymerase sigma factor [Chitinivibrionales bacterium]